MRLDVLPYKFALRPVETKGVRQYKFLGWVQFMDYMEPLSSGTEVVEIVCTGL